MKHNCAACKQYRDVDRAHIRTRGAGAGWEDWEWLYLCRVCHVRSGSLGWVRFIYKYPHIMDELNQRGWKLENILGITKLIRINNEPNNESCD